MSTTGPGVPVAVATDQPDLALGAPPAGRGQAGYRRSPRDVVRLSVAAVITLVLSAAMALAGETVNGFGLSFVSGHAMIVWTMGVMLWPHFPARWRLLLPAAAVANGVARIYLGAHNPFDIVSGQPRVESRP